MSHLVSTARIILATVGIAAVGALAPSAAFAATSSEAVQSMTQPAAGNCAGPMNPDGSCVPLFPPSAVKPAPSWSTCRHLQRIHDWHRYRRECGHGPVVK
jgi:hypothetical protein